ncbi:MAG: HNH endonuclease [Gemmatimonadetes bacterium]|nr:HNH endonuclease [Gemmatimonadota bacterium]
MGLLAERALAVGFAGEDVPVSGSRAERYQVVLHVEPATLRAQGEPGMSELEDGTRFLAENSRRLACDASVVEVAKGPDGSVLDVGRRSRTVPPALRRALEAPDRGCRFPGCGLRFTDAHHIEHWADGGETSLRNTLLLCGRHHRLVHEEGHRVFSDANGQVVFFSPTGKAIAASPPRPSLSADPLEELVRRNRERDVAPNRRSGMPEWKRDRDVPREIEAAALEALEGREVLDAQGKASTEVA